MSKYVFVFVPYGTVSDTHIDPYKSAYHFGTVSDTPVSTYMSLYQFGICVKKFVHCMLTLV